MKTASRAGAGLAATPALYLRQVFAGAMLPAKYQPTWESLSQYQVPDWYRDAKFGIFLHWGVYSVPAHDSEWYPRLMYRRESPVFQWHADHWGPQSMFGYKDFIPMFKAQNWAPGQWVDLFKRAGAKYVVPVGEHHDGFPMYDCIFTRWTAAKMGPHRDVVGELGREVREQGLRLGISSHRAFDWSYYTFDDHFDTVNPRYAGLYGKAHPPAPKINSKPGELRQTASPGFLQDWYARTIQIVDQYRPDLIWFDFGFEAPEFEPYRKEFGAYFYNQAEKWGRGVVLNYKHDAYPEKAAVLDIERGLLDEIRPNVWQTDTSVSWKSWGYIKDDQFKTPGGLIHELIDITSKNGCLLLNVGPKPDGTIPEQAEAVLLGMGKWLTLNGEAIYGTRPWKVYGEGPTKMQGGYFKEQEVKFTPQDLRFTQKKDTVYAICMAWPGSTLKIESLGTSSEANPGQVADVRLIGVDQKLDWKQNAAALSVQVPDHKPCDFAYVFKVTMTM